MANDPNRPPFEQPLLPLEAEIERLEGDTSEQGAQRLAALRLEHRDSLSAIYAALEPWDIVSRVARHPRRPQSTDYLRRICSDFCQLHGDRCFGDDPAILTGFARIGKFKVMVVAHRKGRDTNERMLCNFGCAHPEGYRKALKNMQLAEKFGLPVVTLVDTPGAYPGLGAEERGQAEAIAVNLREMSRLRTPIVSVIIGEGGSGGALGIAVADRVGMLRYSWYSVISPEGCAAILWKQARPDTNAAAATALHLTAEENLRLGTIDEIVDEPVGGAHRDHEAAAEILQRWIIDKITELKRFKIENLIRRRYERLRQIGSVQETGGAA
ncbi:MAG: acetyl-CoA carboxylase carboxyltransferase subunit alpha [Phycisphaerales bacterium]|nr:acetyl-CoA carboxylase carboxyltransferase subunit alpha [Phycisphaerales bacterium]